MPAHRVVLTSPRPCKAKKVKCGEEKPNCLNCQRQGEACDYSIRLNWDGRTKRKAGSRTPERSFVVHGSLPSAPSAATSGPLRFTTSTSQDSSTTLDTLKKENYGRAKHGELGAQSPGTESLSKPYSEHPALGFQKPSPVSLGSCPSPTITPSTAGMMGALSGTGHDGNLSSLNSDSPSVLKVIEHGPELPQPPRQGDLPTAPTGPFAAYPASMLPSPEHSALDGPGLINKSALNPPATIQPSPMASMLPPYHIPPQTTHSDRRKDRDYTLSPENRAKRIRLSPLSGSALSAGDTDPHAYDTSTLPQAQNTQMNFVAPVPPSSPFHTSIRTPLTPATSSTASEDLHQRLSTETSPLVHHISPDFRRLSVNSLLSGPAGDGLHAVSHAERFSTISAYPVPDIGTDTVTYGLDRGFPDLDVSKNDDENALNGMSPATPNDNMEVMVQNQFGDDFYVPTEFGFGLQAKDTVFAKGGYYAKPVPVKIPRSLEPLPAKLLQNPMNLLYFHHFLNHTARILVPHDCSENPFRKILPQSKTYFES